MTFYFAIYSRKELPSVPPFSLVFLTIKFIRLIEFNFILMFVADSSFKDYFLTYPRVYHAREKRSVSSSSDYRVSFRFFSILFLRILPSRSVEILLLAVIYIRSWKHLAKC